MLRQLLIYALLMAPWLAFANNGVVLIYHHVSTETPPSTTISPAKFAEHMQLLSEEFTVIDAAFMVEQIRANKPLPDKAVAITFDDGYRNIMENGHPILRKYDFPYTIFVNPVNVGSNKAKLTWDELRQLSKEGVTIANHFWDHRHLMDKRGFPDDQSWLNEFETLLLQSEEKISQELGYSKKMLAFPYGEYNEQILEIMRKHDFIGWAQHSGAIGPYSDVTQLTRFPAAGIFTGLNSLKTKLRSLNMPVLDIRNDQKVFVGQHRPDFALRINSDDLRPSQFQCFFEGEPLNVNWQDDWVEIELEQTLMPGRHRINCTAPSRSKPGRFYWHSQPWFISKEDGSWLE